MKETGELESDLSKPRILQRSLHRLALTAATAVCVCALVCVCVVFSSAVDRAA